jgi:hypothetical protein
VEAAGAYQQAQTTSDWMAEHEVKDDPAHPGRVRQVLAAPGWIPFAEDGSGNFLAVDMDPAAGGTVGQLIEAGSDQWFEKCWVAGSLTEYLQGAIERITAELPQLQPAEWAEEWQALPEEWMGPLGGSRRRVPAHEHLLRETEVHAGEQPLSTLEPLALLPVLRNADLRLSDGIDLSPLAGRELNLLKLRGPVDPSTVDTSPLRHVRASHVHLRELQLGEPELLDRIAGLELLDVKGGSLAAGRLPHLVRLDLDGCAFDASALGTGGAAGTSPLRFIRAERIPAPYADGLIAAAGRLPELKSAQLEGSAVTDLSPLLGHPGLTHLNLAGNPISDYTPLASLPALTGLELSLDQWRVLRGQLPDWRPENASIPLAVSREEFALDELLGVEHVPKLDEEWALDELPEGLAFYVMVNAPGPWTDVHITVVAAGNRLRYREEFVMADGGPSLIRELTDPPSEFTDPLHALRELDHRPGEGSWLTLRIHGHPGYDYEVDADYVNEPPLELPATAYAADLKRYPRSDRHTPAWLRQRLNSPTSGIGNF